VSVNTHPDLDDKNMTAIVTEKDAEIEGLKTEEESEVGALNDQLEVRNISIYKLSLALSSI
jgi:hypothetical protein